MRCPVYDIRPPPPILDNKVRRLTEHDIALGSAVKLDHLRHMESFLDALPDRAGHPVPENGPQLVLLLRGALGGRDQEPTQLADVLCALEDGD